jgi:hypothetical protein
MALNVRIVFKLALKISEKPQSFLKAERMSHNYAVGSSVKMWREGVLQKTPFGTNFLCNSLFCTKSHWGV